MFTGYGQYSLILCSTCYVPLLFVCFFKMYILKMDIHVHTLYNVEPLLLQRYCFCNLIVKPNVKLLISFVAMQISVLFHRSTVENKMLRYVSQQFFSQCHPVFKESHRMQIIMCKFLQTCDAFHGKHYYYFSLLD